MSEPKQTPRQVILADILAYDYDKDYVFAVKCTMAKAKNFVSGMRVELTRLRDEFHEEQKKLPEKHRKTLVPISLHEIEMVDHPDESKKGYIRITLRKTRTRKRTHKPNIRAKLIHLLEVEEDNEDEQSAGHVERDSGEEKEQRRDARSNNGDTTEIIPPDKTERNVVLRSRERKKARQEKRNEIAEQIKG